VGIVQLMMVLIEGERMGSSHSDRRGEDRRDSHPHAPPFFAEAQARVTGLSESVRRVLREGAKRQRDFTADQLISLARAARHGAAEMHAALPHTANAVQHAAGRMEDLLVSWRGRNMESLAPAFRRLARDRPATVFAGAVLAGFVLSQLLKARRSGLDSRH
jgi:hypothetical protein